MEKLKTGKAAWKKKKSSSLSQKTWDFPVLPSLVSMGVLLSAIPQVSWGLLLCQALASLAHCTAGLRSSAGHGAGPWCGMGALFLSCLLPRTTPGSTLAHSGCKAAMKHLLKTSGTAASLGCKSLETTITKPPRALGTAALGVLGLVSLIRWSPGRFSWLSQLCPSCKSPSPEGPLFLVPWQYW